MPGGRSAWWFWPGPASSGPVRPARANFCCSFSVRCGALGLSGYLLWRWRKNGPDRRYQTMLGKAQSERGMSFARGALQLVFALQAPLQFVVALPVQLGQIGGGAVGAVGLAGGALAIVGILFELVGDWQLVRFKSEAANRERVLDKGLWRFTRHPNYFGDCCVWWGLYLIAAESGIGIWALPGPVLLTFLLTRWSGMPTIEGRLRARSPAMRIMSAERRRSCPGSRNRVTAHRPAQTCDPPTLRACRCTACAAARSGTPAHPEYAWHRAARIPTCRCSRP